METKVMERRLIGGNIPIWEWNDMPLIRVGKATYVMAKPIVTGIRNMGDAKKIVDEFKAKYNCQATITYDTEWGELCNFLKVNFATKNFIELNSLKCNEVLLLDSMSADYVLAAGSNHRLNEIFTGFISGDDADGEPQVPKVLFLTIRLSID